MDGDLLEMRVDLVDNPLVSDTNPIEPFGTREPLGLMGKRICPELFDLLRQAGYNFMGETAEILFDRRLEDETIRGHPSSVAVSSPPG